jgi:hypothetical protein
MSTPIVAFYEFDPDQITDLSQSSQVRNDRVPGFFAVSTARTNVEEELEEQELEEAEKKSPLELTGDPNSLYGVKHLKDSEKAVQKIAEALCSRTNHGQESAEIVVVVHGYNTGMINIKNWYNEIWRYANEHVNSNRFVLLGYRWSSEKVKLKNTKKAIASLPLLLNAFLIGGFGLAILSALLSNQINLAFVLGFFLATLVLSLVILKVVVYFRDSYRATNFGVPDLVEIIRQLDQEVFKVIKRDYPEAITDAVDDKRPALKKRVKLNFIAHSMGGFVTTNAVRILSDVFDPQSIGQIDCSGKAPPADIGRVFCLGRLVLASPDIPAQAIITGRANFLRSSLRRFEEAYLFSNEGDLALRIASTAANYFSFPTHSREQGHRLGNVTVKPISKGTDPEYGVVNDRYLATYTKESRSINYLEINTVNSAIPLSKLDGKDNREVAIANLFTYFDCTNYCDYKYEWNPAEQKLKATEKPTKILSYRLDKYPQLNFIVYIRLMLAWFRGKIDVHGGYFYGEFTRRTIYQLAFVGFQNFLATLESDTFSEQLLQADGKIDPQIKQEIADLHSKVNLLKQDLNGSSDPASSEQKAVKQKLKELRFQLFSKYCYVRSIQVAFSPIRYQLDILERDPDVVESQIKAVEVSQEVVVKPLDCVPSKVA